MRGISNIYIVGTTVSVAASIVPVTTGLTSPIAANQRQTLRWWVPITVGAAGGVRALIAVPAGGALFRATYTLHNTVAPSITDAIQAASGTAFTNALANAGSHWLEIEAEVRNGTTAGNVDLQVAQNTSDATAIQVLSGASLVAIIHD